MPSAKRYPRIDQLLASLGYGSRREIDLWLKKTNRITAKGYDNLRAEMRIDPSLISFDSEDLDHPNGLLIIMNKPLGLVCSHDSREGASVYELLPERWRLRSPRVETVGRLDKDTSGLLLLTDQHDLLHQLTSPRNHVSKVYEAKVENPITEKMIQILASGKLLLEGESKVCQPAILRSTGEFTAQLTLSEGRYHQVRRMLATVGAPVVTLHRSRFGSLELNDLKPGEFKSIPIPNHWEPLPTPRL